jgi:hypothetical protein
MQADGVALEATPTTLGLRLASTHLGGDERQQGGGAGQGGQEAELQAHQDEHDQQLHCRPAGRGSNSRMVHPPADLSRTLQQVPSTERPEDANRHAQTHCLHMRRVATHTRPPDQEDPEGSSVVKAPHVVGHEVDDLQAQGAASSQPCLGRNVLRYETTQSLPNPCSATRRCQQRMQQAEPNANSCETPAQVCTFPAVWSATATELSRSTLACIAAMACCRMSKPMRMPYLSAGGQ